MSLPKDKKWICLLQKRALESYCLTLKPEGPHFFARMSNLNKLKSTVIKEKRLCVLKSQAANRKPKKKNSVNAKKSISERLSDKILERFFQVLQKQTKFLTADHPRFNQLTESGCKFEAEGSLQFLKAVFMETVWFANVSKKMIQRLLLFDRSSWLRSRLKAYLRSPSYQFRCYRRAQTKLILKDATLEPDTKGSYLKNLGTQEDFFRKGCQEFLALLSKYDHQQGANLQSEHSSTSRSCVSRPR